MQTKPETKQGKIVVANNGWPLTDEGFQKAFDAGIFVTNVAKWFTGGRLGKFHAYSTYTYNVLTGTALRYAMTNAGHTWSVGTDITFNLETLLTYDGIFLGGNAADNKVLIDYVNAGGNVYLLSDTSDPQVQANKWNAFLNEFGLEFSDQENKIIDNQIIFSSHPIFAGVKYLFQRVGQSIIDIDTGSKDNQIHLVRPAPQGLYAVYESASGHGKIVVSNDEETLTDSGFVYTPDAETFVQNIAKWFVKEGSGQFLAYSNNFGLTQGRLKKAMEDAGHKWTVTTDKNSLNPNSLSTYNGIFVGGYPVDNQVLIDYVKNGGNVYLMGGTGLGGGAEAEAYHWKTFLNNFGLEFSFNRVYNGVRGKQPINSSHPIFAGVKHLYQANGQSIIDIAPESKDNQILVTHLSQRGLYAVYDKSGSGHGKIVVSNDDNSLGESGFVNNPDAETFIKNIAKWFVKEGSGKFLAYSNSYGAIHEGLKKAMEDAGHKWTVTTDKKSLNPNSLSTYNGIFVGGYPADNQVLIDYVKNGGNVYLMGGTGLGGRVEAGGSAEAEANYWKIFLNAFGLEFAPQYHGVKGKVITNTSHPIFAGVKYLYQVSGQFIVDMAPESKDSQIIVSHTPEIGALYAVFDGAGVNLGNMATTGQFKVPSNSQTGVEFTNTQTTEVSYKFTPSGTWKPGRDIPEYTAEGFKGMGDALQKSLKYPNNKAFSLVAVNKKTGAVTEVGKETTIVVKPGETLVFMVNDFPPHYEDNTGTLTIKWSALN